MSGIIQPLMAGGGVWSYRVTVAAMSYDTGSPQFHGYGSGAWKSASVWNPNNGLVSGAITTTTYKNGSTTGTIEAVYSATDVAGALYIAMSGSVPASSTYIKSIIFQTASGAIQSGTFFGVDTFISPYTRYRFTVGTNWNLAQVGEIKTLLLYN